MAGSLAGCSGTSGDSPSNASGGTTAPDDGSGLSGDDAITEFVEREGSTLTRAGDPYRFSGMMALDLTRLDVGKPWVNRAMAIAREYDIDAFRCWGFSNNPNAPASHTAPGAFDDTWLDLFDYTIAKAKQTGVRLIVPLLQGVFVDSPGEGDAYAPSPAAYKAWSDSAPAERGTQPFIEDAQANEYYKEYVEHVLTRENQYTGVEYRNEPAILCWECANELEYKRPETAGDPIDFWYEDIASFITSLDSNHLVGTGMHGSMGEIYEPWTERCAFLQDHMVDEIDVCSFHDYPIYRAGEDGEAVDLKSPELARRYAAHKRRLAAEEVGKPVYAGEYGVTFNPTASVASVTKLETEAAASDITDNADVPMKYPDQHDDGVLVRRRESISGIDLEHRKQYWRNLTDLAAEREMEGVCFWTLASDARPEDASDAERRRHRIEHDDLITYPGDSDLLGVVQDYSDRVATQ